MDFQEKGNQVIYFRNYNFSFGEDFNIKSCRGADMLKTQKNVKMNCTIFKMLKCFKIINKNANFVIYKPYFHFIC